ncbi:DNA-directed RNA polymerase I subunit RPA43 [Brachyhypopomus gauderio]|uniref:DNA-directed RNA polymerase I subunit RPA43 n=1 Tax=Brachyhypopomus gauderio TaxID=698409 RepID=UPI0040432887
MANIKASDDGSQVTTVTPVTAAAHSAGDVSVPPLIPGFVDACKLIATPYSCLVMETHRRHVVLSPMYLKKKKTGIQEELNAELLKYSSSLKGVPLAYDGIKVVGQHGDILDDHGYIHLNIEASFVIFKPKNKEKLVGVINKIAVGHVGCLVHGCFNACVLKPNLLSPEQWRNCGLRVGGTLTFKVFQLDADAAGVLLIRGHLGNSRVQELVAAVSDVTEPDSAAGEETAEGDGVPSHKKKKKKKDKRTSADDVSGDQAGDAMTLNVNGNGTEAHSSPGSQRKDKKKKKKDKVQEECKELAPPADLPWSDSSGYVSDKSSRKRKAQEVSNMPEAKKKKNK